MWQEQLWLLPGQIKAQVPVDARAHASSLLGGAGHSSSLHSVGGHDGLTSSDEENSDSSLGLL